MGSEPSSGDTLNERSNETETGSTTRVPRAYRNRKARKITRTHRQCFERGSKKRVDKQQRQNQNERDEVSGATREIITMFLGKCKPSSEELGRRITVEGCIASDEGNYADWGSMSNTVSRSRGERHTGSTCWSTLRCMHIYSHWAIMIPRLNRNQHEEDARAERRETHMRERQRNTKQPTSTPPCS